MKDELQGKLVEILSSIQAAAGKAGDFAMGQLPDIAQSYVAYGRASSTLGMLSGLLILSAVAVLLVKGWRWCEREGCDYFPFAMIGMILTGLGGGIFMANTATALLVWFAPKVWLLKEIAGLLK